ncbi:putative quinol monooxygenase [Xylophilus sp. GOD-11R]|uniref:antibiotic biosynthesis monooxygenase family protein n=1 Tax=Xylophilus sp. GOD-11R TaxID=3089814 RepID=UPI00298CB293|nr:putative quinol monooxygenase [Xylophilus sp. GOD-11R]WPB59218.1 putative quinol monooxygenase [Xylophilus sp. GOD-11R]
MSAATPLVVVARWQIAPDAFDEVLAQVAELREASLGEPGCLGYEVFQPIASHGSLLLIERYRDDASLEAHRQSPHYRTHVVERILPKLMARQVEILQALQTG